MANWKIPNTLGFTALLDFIKAIKKASDANTSDVSSLQEDIQTLATNTTKTFSEIDEALATMDIEKLDKNNAVEATLPTSGWATDNTATGTYALYYDLTVTGAAADDRAQVLIAPASMPVALACALCPTCEVLADKIRFWAISAPLEAITVQYWIDKGKE